ncbi:MAG: FKBP-type peptidyl-prolyl cis-trans isomerase [Bacteroidales bacterium]|jgi:FKBP-type peptidyl-prolyl cis-trans isomerase|nr:FKBP-type peptidyl-prolyl cis-trans isomerase [Bacteroidales bacterium]
MKRKYLLFFILVLVVAFSSCLYKGVDEGQTHQEEMILLTNYINDKEKDGINIDTTDLGVYYYVINSGNGLYPETGDTLTVKYDGYLIGGSLFYSTNLLAEKEYSFVLGESDAIEGWNDGLKLIKKGSKVELMIPSRLGFGDKWNGNVPPNNTLIYIIEMMDIKPKKL